MRKVIPMIIVAAIATAGSVLVHAQASPQMSFFITSVGPGNGANLGGLAGADKHCQTLAAAAGVGGKKWQAYLSVAAADGKPAVNAKDRIDTGPWYNAKGQVVAKDLADLHGEATAFTKQSALNEKGEVVNGRGDTPNKHDILTGSKKDGTVADGAGGDGDVRQLDQQWRGQRVGRPLRSHGRRRCADVAQRRARLEGLQPGEPARHRRRWAVLLLRRPRSRPVAVGT